MSSIHDRLRIHRHPAESRPAPAANTDPHALPRFAQSIPPDSDFQELVDEFKLELVYRALAQSGGNHRRAAALIGVHRSSFTRMLHRLEGARNERRTTHEERSAPPALVPTPGGA